MLRLPYQWIAGIGITVFVLSLRAGIKACVRQSNKQKRGNDHAQNNTAD